MKIPCEAGTLLLLARSPGDQGHWFEILPPDPADPDGQLIRNPAGATVEIHHLQEELSNGTVVVLKTIPPGKQPNAHTRPAT